ncbi:MAG: STAS domain-containing protein [Planctomycetota bacterium]
MQHLIKIGVRFPQIVGEDNEKFMAELARAEASDYDEIVLDFEGTDQVNSLALGTIFTSYQKLASQGRRLKLIHVNDRIRRLLQIANLAHVIGINTDK